jgi:hypothetical protein
MPNDNIESTIDFLLGQDPNSLNQDEIIKKITGGKSLSDLSKEYVDLQSDEGFNKELENSEKSVENLLESLKPSPLPLPIEKIEELACLYSGDFLYSSIILESLKYEDKDLHKQLLDYVDKEEKIILPEDIGIKTNIDSLYNVGGLYNKEQQEIDHIKGNIKIKKNKGIESKNVVKFLEKKSPKFLEKINESLFDNLDPLLLGKPSNSGSKKNRTLKILGFDLELEVIMKDKAPLYFKIKGNGLNVEEANKKIEDLLKNNKINRSSEDFKEFKGSIEYNESRDSDNETDSEGSLNSDDFPEFIFNSEKIGEYDSEFFPDGDDPLIDQDCLSVFAEDPITGDPIVTKENFEEILEEFCDPLPSPDFKETRGPEIKIDETPIKNEVNVKAIQDCLDNTTDKINNLKKNTEDLARWQNLERYLEEISYHYQPIYEYQKALANIWKSRIDPNTSTKTSSSTGSTGSSSSTGSTGTLGSRSSTGATGSRPSTGATGSNGITGSSVIRGTTGTTGTTGSNSSPVRSSSSPNLGSISNNQQLVSGPTGSSGATGSSEAILEIPDKLSNLQLGLQLLSYNDSISELDQLIFSSDKEYEESKSSFLLSNSLYSENIFKLKDEEFNLNQSELKKLFSDSIQAGDSFLKYEDSSLSFPIDKGVEQFKNYKDSIRIISEKPVLIESLKSSRNQLVSLRKSILEQLSVIFKKEVNESNLLQVFNDDYNSRGFNITGTLYNRVQRVFENVYYQREGYDSYGYDFLKSLDKFSVRFTKTTFNVNLLELKFELGLMTDLPNSLPYKYVDEPGKISLNGPSSGGFLKKVSKPDIEKIKIGNEYASNGGLLYGYPTDYFKSCNVIKIKNYKSGESDVANFYDFLEKVLKTNESKSGIISEIIRKRGLLYGRLIEVSASPWLFFDSKERGDNDARDPSKLRPSSFIDGEPNEVFNDFWSNYKKKWVLKYKENKEKYINPELNKLIESAIKAAEGLAKTVPLSDDIGIKFFKDYFEVKKRYEQIQEALLICATKIEEIEFLLKPSEVDKNFSGIKCSADPDDKEKNDPENCPPKICGSPGSDIKKNPNYLSQSQTPSDCPTIFQKCWWEQFCKDATKVGLLPYPNGLPPIEDSSYFLGGGPSVRFGMKYWPVGYLPPAFIPIPLNPIDGTPYIRVPLPMVWTIVPPKIIALPLNLGIIVIFIPFIGGFMPSPIIYVKEFITGTSFFLTGLRGPRFIPRKSDPSIKDPLEKIKQALTLGIPDKLIPLPGFGKDNMDSTERILKGLQSNTTKIIDSVPEPSDIRYLRDVQNREREIRKEREDKIKEHNKKYALLDSDKPDPNVYDDQLNAIIPERKKSLSDAILSYLSKGIPDTKDVNFPKDKDKLKIDTPGIIKCLRGLKELRDSFIPVIPKDFVNLKENMREVLKMIKIKPPVKYISDNLQLSNDNKIIFRSDKDPREMDEKEFKELVSFIRKTCNEISHSIMKGNKRSINKRIRKGSFSVMGLGGYSGELSFPPIKITNSLPGALKFKKKKNKKLEDMYSRIMNGMSGCEYTINDFYPFIRYDGEKSQLVMRSKDFKKLVSKKIGLSRKTRFTGDRPLDLEEPDISNFPFEKGPLSSIKYLNESFGKGISLFEPPTTFPLKQDQVSQTPSLGGIVQVTIPGSVIKKFILEYVKNYIEKENGLETDFPEINDPNSPKFSNLEPKDIQKMVRNLVLKSLDPSNPNLPDFIKIADVPIPLLARPTGMVEQILIGLGAPPPARIVFSLLWKYLIGVPKTPLSEKIIEKATESSSKILSKIPWPLTVVLGRDVINIINPLIFSDDLPSWRRMSLKNPYYVVYLDEFIRSAADVSGLFKFTFGSADPIYPIPELQSELRKASIVKKY